MKTYRSHKIVSAVAILSVTVIEQVVGKDADPATGDGGVPYQPASFSYALDGQTDPLVIAAAGPMLARYQPVVGDYLVTYPLAEGETEAYRAFSPKAAFEDGYSEIVIGEPANMTATEAGAPMAVSDPTKAAGPDWMEREQIVIQSQVSIATSLGRIADATEAQLKHITS